MTVGGRPPDLPTCVSLAENAAREGQWRQAERLIRWMEAAGVTPDGEIMTLLVVAYSRAGEWGRAEETLREAETQEGGTTMPVHAYNTLIGALGRKG
eukprot:456903-Prorocentrum_minimum.AAC.1